MRNTLSVRSENKSLINGRFRYASYDVGTWDVVNSSGVMWNRDGDFGNQILLIKVESNLNVRNVLRAIDYSLSDRGNCGHEGDCCGCVSSYVSASQLAGESEYFVKLNYTRNI